MARVAVGDAGPRLPGVTGTPTSAGSGPPRRKGPTRARVASYAPTTNAGKGAGTAAPSRSA